MKLLLINNAESEILDYVETIEKVIDSEVDFDCINYLDILSYKGDPDGYILSGSPRGDNIIESHQKYYQWIKTCNKPILGICAGHHILGYLYGSQIKSSEEIEVGEVNIEVLVHDPLFHQLNSKFISIGNHNDSISLPNDFNLLATSETCEVQCIKHKKKPIYGLQFHPEYKNPEVILNFLNIVKLQAKS